MLGNAPVCQYEVTQLCELTIANSGGETETVRGTPIHPFWSVDRQDWVAMEDLVPGERLRGGDGPCTVVANRPAVHPTSVYNLEIHGHHVYQVGEFGLLVHNACNPLRRNMKADGVVFEAGEQAAHIVPVSWIGYKSGLGKLPNFGVTSLRSAITAS